ncbi:MAG TPA: response regulator [Terriglobales bacterium]|nr:response regulator [Terriglobales bacterium]
MPRVLVIEEEAVIRGLIRVILEGAGYDVLEAGDGQAGFKLAERGAVDGLVLDCMGLRTNGLSMLRQLRGTASTAHLPVIALCGLGQSGAEIGLWANGLVVKPFRPAQLLLKMEMVMGTRVESAPQPYAAEPRAFA